MSSRISGKNIVKMSPTLSFHVKYDNLKEVNFTNLKKEHIL